MRKVLLTVVALLLCLPMVGEGQSIKYYPGSGGTNEWDTASPVIWDDFLAGATTSSNVGQLQWVGSGTVAVQNYTFAANRPGLITHTPGATATAGLRTPDGAAIRYANIESVVFWLAPSTGANMPDVRCGAMSFVHSSNPNDDGIYFEHLAADTNWFAVGRDGANETRTDTGVAFAADTFVRLEIRHNPTTPQWDFYIDGVLKVSKTTGYLPTETYGSAFMYQARTYGTAVVTYWDYFWARLTVVR